MGFQFPCYSLTPSWHHVARHIKLYKCIIFFCGKLLPKTKTKKTRQKKQKKNKTKQKQQIEILDDNTLGSFKIKLNVIIIYTKKKAKHPYVYLK